MLSNFCQIFGGGSDLGEDSIFYLLRLLLISFHSFHCKRKGKKGINPSVEKRSKKRHISFLITPHQIAPLRSGRRSFASHLLSPERAALGQTSLTTGGLTENGRATGADDNGLGVREDGGDGEAAGALDVHEERARLGHKGLLREEKIESVLGPWWTGGCGVLRICSDIP